MRDAALTAMKSVGGPLIEDKLRIEKVLSTHCSQNPDPNPTPNPNQVGLRHLTLTLTFYRTLTPTLALTLTLTKTSGGSPTCCAS